MASEPSSSTESTSLINSTFQNNASNIESARFLQRILNKSKGEKYLIKPLIDPLERAYFYTGLDKRSISVLKYSNTIIADVNDIERSLIHNRLVAFYLSSSSSGSSAPVNTTPTTKNLYSALYGRIPKHVDIRTFRKYLAKFGYVWLKINKGYIVLERPSITFERYHYLKDIIRYREENREIFYVDEIILTTNLNIYRFKKYDSLLKTAAKADVDLSESVFFKYIYAVSKTGVHALAVADHNLSNFTNWMVNDLLPILPEKSVVVIPKYDHHDDVVKKPTLYSLKEDMIEWLERNNVPFIEEMSKGDLTSLIESYTSEIDEFSFIENSFKLKGHELLRLPVCIEDMTPAKHLFELMKLNSHKARGARKLINLLTESVPQATLENYDKHIADLEKDTMLRDIKMDEILDDVVKVYQNMKFKDDDSEVPLSDSD